MQNVSRTFTSLSKDPDRTQALVDPGDLTENQEDSKVCTSSTFLQGQTRPC